MNSFKNPIFQSYFYIQYVLSIHSTWKWQLQSHINKLSNYLLSDWSSAWDWWWRYPKADEWHQYNEEWGKEEVDNKGQCPTPNWYHESANGVVSTSKVVDEVCWLGHHLKFDLIGQVMLEAMEEVHAHRFILDGCVWEMWATHPKFAFLGRGGWRIALFQRKFNFFFDNCWTCDNYFGFIANCHHKVLSDRPCILTF